jgi:predicted outer membrane repeat protein
MQAAVRAASLAGVVSVLAGLALVAGPLATPADAATFEVATADEFAAAVGSVNAADGDHTITLTANLNFTDWSPLYFSPNGGVPAKNVTIDGNGFTVSCFSDDGPCGSWLSVDIGLNGSLTIDDVTVQGFQEGVIYLTDTDLSIEDSTFSDNVNAAATDSWIAVHGGVITDYSSSDAVRIEIENSTFTNNVASAGNAYGGAIYSSSDLYIAESSFSGNVAYGDAVDAQGGAIYAWDGDVAVIESNFEENYAIAASSLQYGYGGAIQSYGSELDVLDSRFELNSATGSGGAINVDGGVTAEVARTDFESNDANKGGAIAMGDDTSLYVDGGTYDGNSAGWQGGAINLYGAYTDIQEATFRENSANSHGGAILVGGDEIESDWSEAWINSSLFVANEAGAGGGALGVYQASEAYVDSTTFTQNEASDGAAISSTFSDVELSHVTIADNVSYSEIDEGNGGGQIWMQGIELRLSGTVVVGAGENRDNCVQSIPSSIYALAANRADDATCFDTGDGNIGSTDYDAELGPLQFNGGPTWTMLPDPDSELVDAWETGQEGGCEAETDDQRGVMRPQDTACDIGAAEIFEPIQGPISTPGGSVWVRILNAVDVDEPQVMDVADLTPAAPAGVAFPYGALGLEIDVWDDGWPVDIEMFSPAPTTQLWKLFDEEWVNPPDASSESVEGGTLWSFRLVDGGFGDNDLSANAFILDPVAMGVGAAFTG